MLFTEIETQIQTEEALLKEMDLETDFIKSIAVTESMTKLFEEENSAK
jgi:hypothetical protein